MWKYVLLTAGLVILTGCHSGKTGNPDVGVYEISAQQEANAAYLSDSALFYYSTLRNKKNAHEFLLKALDKHPDSVYLGIFAVRMFEDGKLPEKDIVSLLRKHPESLILSMLFAEMFWNTGNKELTQELLDTSFSYRLDAPAEGGKARGINEEEADDFQSNLRFYLAFALEEKQYQKADEILKKYSALSPKLNDQTILRMIQYYAQAKKEKKTDFYRQEFQKYVDILKGRLLVPNTFLQQIDQDTIIMLLKEDQMELLELLLTEPLLSNPEDDRAYDNLVSYFAMKSQKGLMLRALEREMKLYHPLRRNRAAARLPLRLSLLIDTDQAALIEPQISRLEQAGRMNDALYSKVAEYYMSKGNFGLARRYVERISDDAMRDLASAMIYQQERNYKKAMRLFMKLERQNPDNAYLKMMVADMALHAGEKEVATQFINEMILKSENNPAFQNFIGYIWAERGINLDRAEKLIAAALKAEPDNYAYLDSMAWVQYQKKDYAKAKEFIFRALEKLDSSVSAGVILDHAGDILHALGETQKAREFWQKAVQSDDPELDMKAIMKKLNPPLREAPEAQNPAAAGDGPKNGSAAPETPAPSQNGNKE